MRKHKRAALYQHECSVCHPKKWRFSMMCINYFCFLYASAALNYSVFNTPAWLAYPATHYITYSGAFFRPSALLNFDIVSLCPQFSALMDEKMHAPKVM
jgi:hypothetical protein